MSQFARAETSVHLGCGDGTTLRRYLPDPPGAVRVDLDHKGLLKNAGDRLVADARSLPFLDASVGLMYSEHFLEHVRTPSAALSEIYRVLRPGGRFIFVTPNGWSYLALAARVVPLSRRCRTIAWSKGADRGALNHATFYRMNTVGAIRRLGRRAGFCIDRLDGYVSEPCYTTGLPVVHLCAIVLHKAIEAAGLHRWMGLTLLAVLRKPESQ